MSPKIEAFQVEKWPNEPLTIRCLNTSSKGRVRNVDMGGGVFCCRRFAPSSHSGFLEWRVWDKGIWNLDQETLFVGDKNTYETKYRNQMGPEMKNLLFMVCQQPSNPLSLARDRELLELGRWQTYNKEMEQVAYWEYAAVVDTLLDSLSLIWGSLCY